jgi:hypothetical protein
LHFLPDFLKDLAKTYVISDMDTPHSKVLAAAREIARRYDAVGVVDPELAQIAFAANDDDAELAASWLALPLDDLDGRTPVKAWADGERERVVGALGSV